MQDQLIVEKTPMGKTILKKMPPVKKKGKSKKIIIAIICVLVVAAIGITIYSKTKAVSTNTEVVYREYSAKSGDITVGIEESGTVVVDTSAVTFPLKATIDNILVTLGTTVTEGDPIVQLNVDSIADVTDEYESKISDAKTDLAEALLNQKTGLEDAKQKYQASLSLTSSAPVKNALTKSDLANDIATAQANITDLQADLAKYTALQSTNGADVATLDTLDANVDALTDQLAEAKDALSDYTDETADDLTDYKSIYTKYTTAKSTLKSAEADYEYDSSDANNTAVEKAEYKLDLAEEDYEDIEDDYDEINDNLDSLQEDVDSYTDQLSDATEAYNDYKETFSETYDVSEDALTSKVKSLTEEIATAQYKLEKLQKSYATDVSAADQTLTNNLSDANTAKEIYEKTVSQLEQQVAAAQDAYDLLANEYADIQASITADGMLYAPCSGTVSAINFTAGSDYTADMTILSVADTKYVDLTFVVSEEDITSVAVGQEAAVTLTAFENQTFDAKVDTISFEPARSSSSVSYTVTVKLNDESGIDVYEGMSGEVTVVQRQAADVIYVENQAISYAGGKSTVLLKNADGSSSSVEVVTGFSDGRYVEIVSGLSEGDTVLAESAVSAQ